MAQVTINQNSVQPLGGPNTGTGTDEGDLWNTAVASMNANFTELYAANTAKAAVTAASSAAAFTNTGTTTLSSAPGNFAIAAPSAGVTKTVSALIASTAARTISVGSGVTFDGTNNVLTSTGIQTVELRGLSSTRWAILSNYSPTTGAMTFSTS